ncbi:MAG: EI24 domain-containing protein [Thauera sp.]|jgi:uncharacterized protein involved in cysteine biosynthesis|nr:EI24 domain-containing protein [Thauera sp.]
MKAIVQALIRASRSLFERGIFWHLLWPGLLSMVLWTAIAIASWGPLTEGVFVWVNGLPVVGSWLSASDATAVVTLVLVKFTLALAFVPLIYLTAAILVAAFALPMMLERVARRNYADLEQRHGGTSLGSAWNSIAAGSIFVLLLLLSLPFWLIPGVGLLVTIALTGWLNQRAFGYDALMIHADAAELPRLREDWRPQMLLLGASSALLAYVPVLNLIAPAFAGLAFVHYLLDRLRQHRLDEGVSILDADSTTASGSLE